MEINDTLHAIEARVALGRPDTKSQSVLLKIESDLTLKIGCVVDPTKITKAMLDDVQRFNEQADNNIFFTGGELINSPSDNALFVLMFEVEKCNGGL